MEGLIPLQKITLKEAGKITGYASDYLGFLIRQGLIKGKKIPKNPPWLVSTAQLLKHCKKTKNLAKRDSSFLLWRDYLTLKQAAEITGYSSDYIGSLIRKGILKGKRFYKLNSWETDREKIKEYLLRRKPKNSFLASLLKLIKNNFHLLFLKISKYAIAFGIFIFVIFGGFVGWAFTSKNQPQTVEIYPTYIESGSEKIPSESNGVNWRNPQNISGAPQVGETGEIDLFSENNSAIYEGGASALAIQNFLQTTTDQKEKNQPSETNNNEKNNIEQDIQKPEGTTTEEATTEDEIIIPESSENATVTGEEIFEESVATDTPVILDNETTGGIPTEIPSEPLTDENILENPVDDNPFLDEQIIDNELTPENPEIVPEIIPEPVPEMVPENSAPANEAAPTSFLEKIDSHLRWGPGISRFAQNLKNFWSTKTVKAQQTPTFEELIQNEFLSAKIKFSFAIGQKPQDILIKQQNNQGQQNNATTGGESSFWEKIKDFFSGLATRIDQLSENLIKKFVSIATAEESPASPLIEEATTSETFLNATSEIANAENETIFQTTTEEIFENATDTPTDILIENATDTVIENPTSSVVDFTRNPDAKIIVWWSLDGQNWQVLENISSQNLSNASNGGYFSYDAPFLKNWDDVKNIKIKFEGVIGGETKIVGYLDSVWVEAKYQEPETVKSDSEDYELVPIKKDWRADETPEFDVMLKGQSVQENNIVENLLVEVSSIFKEEPRVDATLINPDQKEHQLKEDENFTAETHSPTRIRILKDDEFKPGLHKLKVAYEKDGKIYDLETEFSWGVLAINTNKSIYLPQESAYLQMGVLDDAGRTICNAKLSLEITAPDGTRTIFTTENWTSSTSEQVATSNEVIITEEGTTTEIFQESTTTEEILDEETETTDVEEILEPSLQEEGTTTQDLLPAENLVDESVSSSEANLSEDISATTTEENTTTAEIAETAETEITETIIRNQEAEETTSTSEIQEEAPEIQAPAPIENATSELSFWQRVKNFLRVPFAKAQEGENTSTIKTGLIENSEDCGPSTITYKPDYFANYDVATTGVYQIKLTAQTTNGVREITDSFEVRDSVPFDVERIGPTRIWPWASYEINLKIKANEDFSGQVVETVPESFATTGQLAWDVDWKAGENYELKYIFDAPDISPYLYLVGPLRFETNNISLWEKFKEIWNGNDESSSSTHSIKSGQADSPQAGSEKSVFSEVRSWQIASDAGEMQTSYVTSTASTTWKVPTDWNSASNSVEVIGGGGAGEDNGDSGGGGGGGGYSMTTNLNLTSGNTVFLQVGVGGIGGVNVEPGGSGSDTWFNDLDGATSTTCSTSTSAGQSVCAKGGAGGGSVTADTGGLGGSSSTAWAVGTVRYGGGQGGTGNGGGDSGGGGGGAAGPRGEGRRGGDGNTAASGGGGGGGGAGGASSTVGSAGTTIGGAGGLGPNATGSGPGGTDSNGTAGWDGGGGGGSDNATIGGAGGAGREWSSSVPYLGAGGGGGGGSNSDAGAVGGLYGGGGGAGEGGGGDGGKGIIVIKYWPYALSQNHYRWRDDSGLINSDGGWAAATDTATTTRVGTIVKLRIAIANSGTGPASGTVYQLEYAASSTGSCGTYAAVPKDAGSSPFEMVTSTVYANNTTTVNSLILPPVTGSWATGTAITDPSSTSSQHKLDPSYYTEFEYAIKPTTNITTEGNNDYCFRLTNNGTTTNFTYTVTPILTVYVPAVYTISGTVYSDEGITTMSASRIVRVKINGSGSSSAETNGSGAYSISNVTIGAVGDTITVFLDAATNTEKANTITIASSTTESITGLNLYQNRIIITHPTSTPLNLENLDKYDYASDTDMLYTATSSTGQFESSSTAEFFVWYGKTYNNYTSTTASTTNFVDLDIRGTFNASSSQAINVSSTWQASSTQTAFAPATSTVTFTSTLATTTIKTQGSPFYNLTFNGTNGIWTFQDNATTANDLTITAGTASSSYNMNVMGGDVISNINGVLNWSSSTFMVDGTGYFGASSTWNFYNLTFGNGAGTEITTATGTATATISNFLTIAANQTLNAGFKVWEINGASTSTAPYTPFLTEGTFVASSSTFRFTTDQSTNITATTYYNLELVDPPVNLNSKSIDSNVIELKNKITETLKIKETSDNKYVIKTLENGIIEIGTEKHSPPKPYLKLEKWDGEVSLKVGIPFETGESPIVIGDKIRYSTEDKEVQLSWWQKLLSKLFGVFADDKQPKVDIEFYPKAPETFTETIGGKDYTYTQNEQGGVEFDTILYEKPNTNQIVFPIETKGLKFYYQPALNQELKIGYKGATIITETTATGKDEKLVAFRPENVVGSYAVYRFDKTVLYPSQAEAEKYKAGKAFHIYRPKVFDAGGNWIWGELNIDEAAGTLTITVDQNWLDNAVYPVTIDPIFGKTSAGAGTDSGGENTQVSYAFTTPASNGTLTSITIEAWSAGNSEFNPALYSDNAGTPNARLAYLNSGGTLMSSDGNTTTTTDLAYANLTAGVQYWIGHKGTGDYTVSSDSVVPQECHYASPSQTSWVDPWPTDASNGNRHTIYGTYEEAGAEGGPVYTLATTTGQTLTVNNNFVIGNASDTMTVSATTNSPIIDVNGDFTITASSTFLAPTSTFTIAGDWTNNGTFTHNNGTTTFDADTTSTISGVTVFYNLISTTTGKTLEFATDTLATTTVEGTLTLDGGACGTKITLRSNQTGQYWYLNVTGTTSISYVDAIDSNAAGSSFEIPAASSTNSGNNVNWSIEECAITRTISGTVYTDEGTNDINEGKTVVVKVNGADACGGVGCSDDTDTDGVYSISGVTVSAGQTITVFLDGEPEKAVTVTIAMAGDIADLNLYQNRIIARHDYDGPIKITNFAQYDAGDDNDILFAATSSTGQFDASSTAEFFVWASSSVGLWGAGGVAGAISLVDFDNNGTTTASSTQTISVSGVWDATGGKFYPATSTVNFTSTLATTTIKTNGYSFYNLTFNGSGGVWTFQDAATTSNDLTITAGTASSSYNMNVLGGDITGNGTMNWSSATCTLSGIGYFGGTSAWNFYNLTFSGTTTATSTATTTITNILTISANQTLNAGEKPWVLSGAGTPFVKTGTFTPATSTFWYTSTDDATVTAATYYNLNLRPAGTPTYNLDSGTLSTNNYLTIGNGTNGVTVTAAANNPIFDINGDFTISTSSTFVASQSASSTFAGNWTNNGTFTHSSGTTTFDGAVATTTITTGGWPFYNLRFDGTNGVWTFLDAATTTNDLTITVGTASSSYDMVVYGGDITGNGTLNWTDNSVLLTGTGYFGGNSNWNFAGLVFGDLFLATPGTTNATGTGTTTVATAMLILPNHILNAGTKFWIIQSSGTDGDTPFLDWGTFNAETSTVEYAGGAATDISSTTYYNLNISGAGPFNAPAATLNINNNLTCAAGSLNLGGTTTVSNTLYINGTGVLDVAAGNYSLNVGRSWYNTSTAATAFNARSGTVTFTSTISTTTITTGGRPFYNLTFNGSEGIWTFLDAATTSNNLTISAGTASSTYNMRVLGGSVLGNGTLNWTNATFTVANTGNFGGTSEWTFYNLTLGSGGAGTASSTTATSTATTTVSGTLTVATNQTLGGTKNFNITGGNAAGNGTINLTEGTFTVANTGNFGGTSAWTFYNLTLGSGGAGTASSTTAGSTGTTTISSILTISANQTLDAGEKAWVLSGSSTPFTKTGTLTPSTSTFWYISTDNATVTAATYYNLKLSPAGTPIYNLATDTLTVSNDLTIGDSTNASIITATTNNPTIDINGNITISTSSTFSAPTSSSFTIFGNWTNNGTFNHASGTVTFDGTVAGKTITQGGSNFYQLQFSGSGGQWTFQDPATTTATTTILSGTTLIHGVNNDLMLGSLTIESGGAFTKASGTGKLYFESPLEIYIDDQNTTKQNLGNVYIGMSPATVNQESDMVTDNFTVNTGDIHNTKGYELTVNGSTTIYGTLDATDGGGEGDGTVITVGGNWLNSAGTFTASNSTTTFSTSTSGHLITTGGDSFYNLVFEGGGTWTFQDAATTTNDLTIAAGTASSSYDMKVMGGDVISNANGVLNWSSSTFMVDGTGYFGASSTWNFYNLTFGNGAGTEITTATGTATATISNFLTIAASQTLNAGFKVWEIAGYSTTNTPFVIKGTFNASSSNFRYTTGQDTNITPATYYNLELAAGPHYEDFTTYTEVDGSSQLDVTRTKINISLAASKEGAYVRKDMGIGHFGDFEHHVTMYMSAYEDNQRNGVWALSNTPSNTMNAMDTNNDGILVEGFDNSYIIRVVEYELSNASDSYDGLPNTIYYLTIKRSGSTLTVKIYSDAARTTLLDTLSITSPVTTYRYLFGYIGIGSGSTDGTGYNENLNLQEVPAYYTLATTTGSTLTINNNLSIGDGIHPLTVSATSNNPIIDINGTTTISATSTFIAPTSTFTIAGNWINNGTFTHNNGTTTFDGDTTSTISGATTFYNLISTTTSKTLEFATGTSATTTVAGTLTLNGGSCDTKMTLRSNQSSQQWYLNVTGTTSISYVDVKDSNATGSSFAIPATYSTNSGNNTNWSITGCGVTISGTCYTDEGITTMGASRIVRLKVNGAGSYTADTNGSGVYSIANVVINAAGDTLTFFLDAATTSEKANTITIASSTTENITGLDLYQNRIIVTHPTSTPLSLANLAIYTATSDADMLFDATSSTGEFDSSSTAEFFVWYGKTYNNYTSTTAATTTFVDLDIRGTFNASSSQAINVSSTWQASSTQTAFTPATSTVTFTSTLATTTIKTQGSPFYNLTFNGLGGVWTFQDHATTTNDLTITAGTASSSYDMRISGGNVTGNGTLNWASSTFTVSNTGNFGGTSAWTFYNLTFGSGGAGTASSTTAGSIGTTTISNLLTISANQTLDAGEKAWVLSGTSTPFAKPGTLTPSTSTFWYIASTSDATVTAATYYNLYLSPAATRTYNLGAGTIAVYNTFTIGNGTNALTASATSNNPIIDVNGNFTISTSSTFYASQASSTFAANWTNNGTFTHNTGTTTFDATTTGKTIRTNGSSFYNLRFNGTGGIWTFQDNATTANDLNVNAGTASSSYNMNVLGGDVISNGNGVLNWSSSTFMVDGTGYFGASSTWNFYNLTFGNGAGTEITTATGTATATISNFLTIAASQTLNAGFKVWEIAGYSTTSVPFIINGTFNASSSTFRYTTDQNTNITATTYYNLELVDPPAGGNSQSSQDYINDLNNQVSEKLKIKETSPGKFGLKTLDNSLIEIGTERHSPPKPYINLTKWNGEVSMKIGIPFETGETPQVLGDKIRYSTADKPLTAAKADDSQVKVDIDIYPKVPETITDIINGKEYTFKQNEDGGIEFDTILYEKPLLNEIIFPIETQNLDFYYQPALNDEKQEDGITCFETYCVDENGNTIKVRPENAVGSYAVYHENKKNNEYKTGKAFHIYRPRVYDAAGKEIWGELNINEDLGILTITIDQNWLNDAVYPVVVDPAFGWESEGAAEAVLENSNKSSRFTISENGTAISVSAYTRRDNSGRGWTGGIYDNGDGDTDATVNLIEGPGTYTTIEDGLATSTLSNSPLLTAGIAYRITAVGNSGSGSIWINYDSGIDGAYGYNYGNDVWDNPITYGTVTAGDRYSIFVTYTAIEGPVYTLATTTGQTLTVNNNLLMGDGINPITITADTYNPIIDVNGNITISATSTFYASQASSTFAGNWTNSGTFSHNTGTTTFDATSAKTITTNGSPFYNLRFDGTNGIWTFQDNATTANDLNVNAGTASSSYNMNVMGGDVISNANGVLNWSSSTFMVDGTGYFGASSTWNFYNLTFGNGAGSETITATGTATATISNFLTIAASQTLNAGFKVWEIAGYSTTNTPFVIKGTFNASSSDFYYTTDYDTNITATTYYNLYLHSLNTPLFGDDFEAANFTTYWTGAATSGVARITSASTSAARTGNYGARMYNLTTYANYAKYYKNLGSSYNDIYARVYIRIPELWGQSRSPYIGPVLSNSSNADRLYVGLNNESGWDAAVWYISYRDDGGNWTSLTAPATSVSAGTWYSVEVRRKVSATTAIQLWINGNLVINSSGVGIDPDPTQYVGGYAEITEGMDAFMVDHDSFAANTSYIGLAPIYTIGTTTGQTFAVGNNLLIGSGESLLVTATTNNPIIDVNGTTTISTSSIFAAPTSTFTVAGNWTNNGTFTHNNGTTTFDADTTSTISGATTFYNLISTTTGKTLEFATGTSATTTVAGTLTLNGGSCSTKMTLRSNQTGEQWYLNVTGTTSISYVDVIDSNATGSSFFIPATYSTDSGNNVKWTITGCGITISGTVYTDEGITTMGASRIVRVKINGAGSSSAETNGSGVYSISDVTIGAAGDTITVFLDAATNTEKANTITIASSTTESITGLNLYQNRIIATHPTSTPLNLENLDKYDYASDTDILYTATSSTGQLESSSTAEFFVWYGKTYNNYTSTSAGTTNFAELDIRGTFNASSSQTINVSSSWFASSTATAFNSATSTVTFTSTLATTTIKTQGSPFYNLTFNGTSTIHEYYNTGDDGGSLFDATNWQGQTFQPTTTHTITSVKLLLYKNYTTPGTITVSIRATAAGLPAGTDLCSGTTNGNTLPDEGGSAEWREITLGAGCTLDAGTTYAIAVRSATGNPGWRHDESSPAYANGQAVLSDNSGSSWSSWAAGENLFEEWGTAGVWTFQDAATTTNDLTITAGTASSSYNMRVLGGDVTGNGTLNWSSSTFTVSNTGNFGGTSQWTFYNLILGLGGAGTASSTTAGSTGTTTISSIFTISANQTLDAGEKAWVLSGSSTPFTKAGTLTPSTSTFWYISTADATVTAATYYNLNLSPAGTPVYNLATGTVTTNNYLTIGNGTNGVTVTATSNNPILDVNGNFTISATSTFAAPRNSFTIAGNWSNTGTFDSYSGIVTFDATAAKTIDTGGTGAGKTFFDLYFNSTSGVWTISNNDLKVMNNLNLAYASSVDATNRTVTVEGRFINSVGGASTTWTGSTLYLNSLRSNSNLSFNGDDYVDAGDNDNLTPGTQVTFEAWIYLETLDQVASIFNKWNQNVSEDEYIWGVLTNNLMRISWVTGGSNSEVDSTGAVSLGVWQHVAVVRDGTSIVFYINGQPAGSSNPVDNTPFRNGPNSLYIGGQGGRGGQGRYLDGLIDEARIYNRALSATEITEHYQGAFRNESNLLGLWHFSEGSGTSTADSANNNNGALMPAGSTPTWSTYAPLYNINAKTLGGDIYSTLQIGADTDVRMWNSTSTTYTINSSGSLYSMDADLAGDGTGDDGILNVWGDYHSVTSTIDYCSYTTDFDGTTGITRQCKATINSGASWTVDASSTLEVKGGGLTSGDISIIGQGASALWSLRANGTTTIQESTWNYPQFASGTATVLNTTLNNEDVTSTAILNTDWYLGIHVVAADSTSTNIGNATCTISEASGSSTVWKYNAGWSDGAVSQFTTTSASGSATGTTAQPNSYGALRIREYQRTATATATYKYNLAISALGFSDYNYYNDYGNLYLTSSSSIESTGVATTVYEGWQRNTIASLNGSKDYDGLNDPPEHGTWYVGMSADLQFSINTAAVNMGMSQSNDFTTTTDVTLSATTSYPAGFTIRADMRNSLGILISTSTPTIIRFPHENSTPVAWDDTCNASSTCCGFGYTTDDTYLAGGGTNYDRFASTTFCGSAQCWAGFATSSALATPVADRNTSGFQENILTLRVSVNSDQEARQYTGTIYLIATANY